MNKEYKEYLRNVLHFNPVTKGKPDWCPIKALQNNISTEHERSIAELIHSNNMTCED